jgi:hypothetical protein
MAVFRYPAAPRPPLWGKSYPRPRSLNNMHIGVPKNKTDPPTPSICPIQILEPHYRNTPRHFFLGSPTPMGYIFFGGHQLVANWCPLFSYLHCPAPTYFKAIRSVVVFSSLLLHR